MSERLRGEIARESAKRIKQEKAMSEDYDQLAHEALKALLIAKEAGRRYWDGGDMGQSAASMDKLREQAREKQAVAREAEERYVRAWMEREPDDWKMRKPKAEFE